MGFVIFVSIDKTTQLKSQEIFLARTRNQKPKKPKLNFNQNLIQDLKVSFTLLPLTFNLFHSTLICSPFVIVIFDTSMLLWYSVLLSLKILECLVQLLAVKKKSGQHILTDRCIQVPPKEKSKNEKQKINKTQNHFKKARNFRVSLLTQSRESAHISILFFVVSFDHEINKYLDYDV